MRSDKWGYALDLVAAHLRQSDRIGHATDVFRMAIEIRPSRYLKKWNWVFATFDDYPLDAVEQLARKLVGRFPKEGVPFELLGDIAFTRRDMRAAELNFDAALSRQPSAARVREKLARARRYRQLSELFSPVPPQQTEARAQADYAVLVINLDHSVDRLAQCQRAFADSPVPLYRVPGVSARHLPSVAARWLGGWKEDLGTLGCTLAHAAAWEAMLELKVKQCLIVEDDAAPIINLPSKISAFGIPDDFELCFVNERMQWQPCGALDDLAGFDAVDPAEALASWPSTHEAPGSDGYFLNVEGARKLLSFYARDGFAGSPDWRLISYAVPPGGHTRFPEGSIAFSQVAYYDQFGPGRLKAYSLFPCLVREAVPGLSVLREENSEGQRAGATAIW